MKHPDNFGRAEKDSGLIVGAAQQRSIRSQDHTWKKIETVVMCFDLVVIIVERVSHALPYKAGIHCADISG